MESFIDKFRTKLHKIAAREPGQATIPSPPSSVSAHLAPKPTTRPALLATEPDTLLHSLQEKIWNLAYDELQASEPKVVDAFEKTVSTTFHGIETNPKPANHMDSKGTTNREARSQQMLELLQDGLDRTKKVASTKEGIDAGLQAVHAVKGIMDRAVHAAPEAAIAWATVCFGLEILSNPISEALENRKGIQYVLSRMEWYWNLVDLLLDKNKGETSTAALRVELERDIVRLFQKLLSYQMRSICLYYRSGIAIIGRDMLRIDDWAGQLSSIKEAEEAVQRNMEQYNTEESKMQLRKLNDTADTVEKNLQDIYGALQDQIKQQATRDEDVKDKQCLQDLRVTDPRTDKKQIEERKGGLFRDSYFWILEHPEFRRFQNDVERRLLWIKGDPGKGKTMLLCGIIDELERQSLVSLSFFFCQATGGRERNTATSVLRGIIFDLARHNPHLIKHVRKKYDVAGKDLFNNDCSWYDLSEIAATMLHDPSLERPILVVDALDECSVDRERLLDFIAKPSPAKWIVSSRNWVDIEEGLHNAQQKVKLLLELNQDSISQAVNSYIKYKTNQLAQRKDYDKRLRDKVLHYLMANADGTFLWVALVCHELMNPTVRKRHTDDTLKSFPPGLDPLYGRMLGQISQSKDVDVCKEILAVILVSYQPTALGELKVLVKTLEDLTTEEVKEVVGSCGSFLTLQNDVVSFVHQSAKDYLLKKASDIVLPFGIARQHYLVFSRSLELLGRALKRDIYDLQAPGCLIEEVSAPDPDPLAAIRYSCIFWANHLHDSTVDEKLEKSNEILVFFEKNYLQWLEALSLLRSIPAGVRALEKLVLYLQGIPSQHLQNIVQDAQRFILSQKGIIEIAPLQVYTSALIFSPTYSLTRRLFSHEEPSWIELKPRVEANWNACLQTLEGHDDSVQSVVFSNDGQQLASGSVDKTVKIWDATSGACLQTLEGHDGSVQSVVFSNDGQRLASGSYDMTVKIWDATSGACLQTLEGHDGSVHSVVFSNDGHRLASGSDDKTVKIWDATSGACLQTLEGHDDSVHCVVFSNDGHRLATGSEDMTVRTWDTTSGACLRTLKGHDDSVHSVVFSNDGHRLASGSDDKVVKIWDTTSGACLQTFEGHDSWVQFVVFSNDGHRLASGSYDKTVKIWDVTSGACLQTLEGHDGSVQSVVFSNDGQRLASGSEDMTVKTWDATSGACLQTLKGHNDWVQSVVFSNDGQRLASGSGDKTVKIWDVTSGACLQTLEGHNGFVHSVVFSNDGHRLASGSGDKTVKIWDVTSGACLQTLEGHDGWVHSVILSNDGHRLASGSYDETVKIWDATTGACLRTLSTGRTVHVLSFNPADESHLSTSIGALNLDMPMSAAMLPVDQALLHHPKFYGYGVGVYGTWIMKGEQRMLWLPPECRPLRSVVSGARFALGCRSGRVLIIGFSGTGHV